MIAVVTLDRMKQESGTAAKYLERSADTITYRKQGGRSSDRTEAPGGRCQRFRIRVSKGKTLTNQEARALPLRRHAWSRLIADPLNSA